MAISDLAFNPIQPGGVTGLMTGFGEPASTEDLPLKMYDFLIMPIRMKDMQEGNLFVKRFLEGPQTLWEQTQRSIFAIKDLWSITECPDDYLKYLKNIVGWTSDLDYITDALDEADLRRLISVSVPMWKKRGAESTIKEVVNVALPSRIRIWNWFDLRWITDETAFDEQRQGRDSWLFPFPGEPELQEYWSIIRIADPGTTALRTLFKNVVKLMRPVSERYRIIYLLLLDLFEVDDDLNQWSIPTLIADYTTATVEEGVLKLAANATGDNGVVTSVEDASTWDNYVVSARMRGSAGASANLGYGLLIHFDESTGNGYSVALSVYDNKLYLFSEAAWAPTEITNFDFDTVPYDLQADVWYGLRVQVSPDSSGIRIKVYVDGEERIDQYEASPVTTEGAVGIFQTETISLECDEIEVMGLPVDSETIEINS